MELLNQSFILIQCKCFSGNALALPSQVSLVNNYFLYNEELNNTGL